MAIAAVTGLAAEARIARRAGLDAVATGGRPERADALIAGLIRRGAKGLLSFGIAGGLDPRLASGTLVIGDEVRDAGSVWPVDAAWCRALAERLPRDVAVGAVAAAREPVATRAAKQQLRAQSGALIVDLESAAVARLATAAGLPFAVLRAVGDPAAGALPEAALIGLAEDGTTALGAVLVSCLGRPAQIPRLIGLAIETRRALSALVGAGGALDELFRGI
jgi:hopanoid-associated phosphorylase